MKIYSPPQGEGFAVMSSEQVRPKAVGLPDKLAKRPAAGVSLHELICPREGAPEASGCETGARLRPDPAWSPHLRARAVGRGSGESLVGTSCPALGPSDEAGHRGRRQHLSHF